MTTPIIPPVKYVHNHTQQLYSNVLPASISVNIWGRGTGKTWGITARKAYMNAVLMPRSVGAIGCPSFTHMMEHIFGELAKSWEDMGLVEGVDFVCFQKPPEKWKKPFRKIAKNQYGRCIFFRNGSVIKLFSYNYNSLSNGDSIDWLIIDEARLCKKVKIDESIKCLRGNEEHFGHLSIHGSVVYVSDMPRNPTEFWLLDFREQENKARIDEVMTYAYVLSELQQEQVKTKSEKRQKQLIKDIKLVSDEINQLCHGLTVVSFASSLDNIHALGPNKLKQWKATSTDYDWNVAVLNQIQQRVTNGFYPYLDENTHGYHTPRPRHEVNYRAKRNCLWDGDIDYSQPLIIGMDYNSDISCIAVYQLQGTLIRLLKSFYVLHPKKREDVVAEFIAYYQDLPIKQVVYCYDNTAIAEDADKTVKDTFAYKTQDELTQGGFDVIPLFLSQTTHEYRYDLCQGLHKGTHPELPGYTFGYNIDNNQAWAVASNLTQTEIRTTRGKTTFGKDKREEKKRKVSAEKLPHLTEAGDTGLLGVIAYYNLTKGETRDLAQLGLG